MSFRVILGLLAIVSLVSGCAGSRVAPVLEPTKESRVWPDAPDVPRYAYAGTLIGEKDFVPKTDEGKSTGTIILEIVTGLIFGEPDYITLVRPTGGMVDSKGRVLVLDAGLGAVVVFDMAKAKVTTWESPADGESFGSPIAIVEDGKDGYWVSDSEAGQLFHIDKYGDPLAPIGKGVLNRPTGLARDPVSGNLYVADTGTHRILVLNPAGEVLDTIGMRGTDISQLNYPTHLTLSGRQLYVADTLNFRVQVFDLDGNGKLTLGQLGIRVGDMTRPKGVAVGRDGRIYVVESYFDHLLVYDPQGRFLLPIGGEGNGIGQFYLPAGVWTDGKDRVFVADMFNGRICIFKELTVGVGE